MAARLAVFAGRQGADGFGVAPLHYAHVGGRGVDAGELRKRLQHFGGNALGFVVFVLARPVGARLHGPALDLAAPGLGRFARQPGDAGVLGAGRVPLRAHLGDRWVYRVGKAQQQGPARGDIDVGQVPVSGDGDFAAVQQHFGLGRGHGQHHAIDPGKHVHAAVHVFGANLPLLGVQGVALKGDSLFAYVYVQRGRPDLQQAVHGGHAHQVRLHRCAVDDGLACRIQRADGVHAPALGDGGGSVQRLLKARIAHGEELCAEVKTAMGAVAAGHAATHLGLGLDHGDLVACLLQGACADDAGHASADNGKVLAGRGARGGFSFGLGRDLGRHVEPTFC